MYVSSLQVEWMTARDGDSCLVFSGGLPQDVTGAQPAITVMHGKNTTVLEMEFCVLDFTTLTDRCVRIYLKKYLCSYKNIFPQPVPQRPDGPAVHPGAADQ